MLASGAVIYDYDVSTREVIYGGALEQVLAAGNLARAATLAHQLKGAAGSYSFPLITEAALRVERIAKEGRNVDAVRDAVTDLAQLCRRAQPPGG